LALCTTLQDQRLRNCPRGPLWIFEYDGCR